MQFSFQPVCIVLALVSLMTFADRAAAAVRPHRSGGHAHFVSETAFVGSGRATHLGYYDEVGTVSFSPTDDPDVLHVDGAIVYTAASGHELHAVISGELNGLTGAITATITYAGGTGRFTSASGSAILAGQSFPDGTISVTVHGTIDF